MRTNALHSTGDYISVKLQGISKIDATKLNFTLLTEENYPSTPPIHRWLFFFEIENHSSRTWEWNSYEWELQDGETTREQGIELVYTLDQLPGKWDALQFDIPPRAIAKTIFVYDDSLDEDADWVLSYKKAVAEGWYEAIKQDESIHLTDYTDKYEEIEMVVPANKREELRWENHSE